MTKNRSKNSFTSLNNGPKKSAKKMSLPPMRKGKSSRPSRINGPSR